MAIVSANVASIKIDIYHDGALQINSASAYDSSNNLLGRAETSGLEEYNFSPTNIQSWASTTTGEKLNLATAQNLGPLVATFKDHDRSFIG